MNENFIIQFFQRIATESPRFFVYIRWAAGVAVVVLAIAAFLVGHHIWIPPFADQLSTISSAAWPILTAIWGMSLLPVKDTTVSAPTTPVTPSTPDKQ